MPSYCGRKTMNLVAGHKYADILVFGGSKSKTTKAFAFLEVWFSRVYGFPRHSFCRVPTLRKPGDLSQSRNAMHIQGNYYVEILHMWDMSTTRNRLCMRCGFGNFDVKLENFTMKIHCFRWCMVHVPMPSHISCQKTRFFSKTCQFFYWVGSFHDWMVVSSKVFSGFPTVVFSFFFLDIFVLLCGFPKNPLKEMAKLLNWTNFECPDWNGGKCDFNGANSIRILVWDR